MKITIEIPDEEFTNIQGETMVGILSINLNVHKGKIIRVYSGKNVFPFEVDDEWKLGYNPYQE